MAWDFSFCVCVNFCSFFPSFSPSFFERPLVVAGFGSVSQGYQIQGSWFSSYFPCGWVVWLLWLKPPCSSLRLEISGSNRSNQWSLHEECKAFFKDLGFCLSGQNCVSWLSLQCKELRNAIWTHFCSHSYAGSIRKEERKTDCIDNYLCVYHRCGIRCDSKKISVGTIKGDLELDDLKHIFS